MTIPVSAILVPRKKLRKLAKNYAASAEAAELQYVNDKEEGITRQCRNGKYTYYFKSAKISDKKTLSRIRKLVIPPTWEQVWICPKENGHIQVTGLDSKQRKQYRYHTAWSSIRDQTKYYRLRDFARTLPAIRSRLKKDLCQQGFAKEKVLAAIVSVMESTSIRVGNSLYEKLYGSFGLSTMKDRHVKIQGPEVRFSFKGKKGIYHNISLKSSKLARIISQCRDIPGKELFQYYDREGNRHAIDSGDVNAYIREISGGDFTSKDFRTWTGTVKCLNAFRHLGFADSPTQVKKLMNEAMDIVAHQLGNTRTVCKKHYIHPGILSDYENGKLEKYISEIQEIENDCDSENSMTPTEQVLQKILEH